MLKVPIYMNVKRSICSEGQLKPNLKIAVDEMFEYNPPTDQYEIKIEKETTTVISKTLQKTKGNNC